jgi:hypothetical protein
MRSYRKQPMIYVSAIPFLIDEIGRWKFFKRTRKARQSIMAIVGWNWLVFGPTLHITSRILLAPAQE